MLTLGRKGQYHYKIQQPLFVSYSQPAPCNCYNQFVFNLQVFREKLYYKKLQVWLCMRNSTGEDTSKQTDPAN